MLPRKAPEAATKYATSTQAMILSATLISGWKPRAYPKNTRKILPGVLVDGPILATWGNISETGAMAQIGPNWPNVGQFRSKSAAGARNWFSPKMLLIAIRSSPDAPTCPTSGLRVLCDSFASCNHEGQSKQYIRNGRTPNRWWRGATTHAYGWRSSPQSHGNHRPCATITNVTTKGPEPPNDTLLDSACGRRACGPQ